MPTYQERARSIFCDPKSFATTLLVVAWDRFGPELTNWSPLGVRQNLDKTFSMKMPTKNFDRLMAAIGLVTTDEFYQRPDTFIRFCNILSGDGYDPRVWDPADADEMAWGITEAMLIHPGEGDEPFTDEIRWYMGAVLEQEGIVNPPDVLRLALQDQVRQNIPSEYADDPEMFSALWGSQNARSEEIREIVRGNLQELVRQLCTAPLVYGEAGEGLVKKIQAELSDD